MELALDHQQNLQFKLQELVAQQKDTLNRNDLKALELDFDEITIVRGAKKNSISFRSSKNTPAYSFSKNILFVISGQRIKEKSVSLKQTFLGEPELAYNLKYTYTY